MDFFKIENGEIHVVSTVLWVLHDFFEILALRLKSSIFCSIMTILSIWGHYVL